MPTVYDVRHKRRLQHFNAAYVVVVVNDIVVVITVNVIVVIVVAINDVSIKSICRLIPHFQKS